MSGFQTGDLIFHSKPYVYALSNECRGLRCDYCFTKHDRLKRCGKCFFTYYCDKNCQTEAWNDVHKLECKYIRKVVPNVPMYSLRVLSHILFKIKKFGEDEPFEDVHDHKMTFRKLVSHKDELIQDLESMKRDKPMMTLYAIIKDYLGEHNVPDLLNYIEIFGKMYANTFSIYDDDLRVIGIGVYLGGSIFSHSCEPDAEFVFDGLDLYFRAVKNIPHRDVTKIYISHIDQYQLLEDRQMYLAEKYYFECKCIRCTTSKYEDLMTETITNENESQSLLLEFKETDQRVREMQKNGAAPADIYDFCMLTLAQLKHKLADTHIYRIKMLEYALDACTEDDRFVDAMVIGSQLIEPYRLVYGEYQSAYGVLLFKVGKMQHQQGLLESANTNLTKAEQSLRITHGTDHSLYNELLEILFKCQLTL